MEELRPEFYQRITRNITSFLFTHRFYYEVLNRFNFFASDEIDTAAAQIGARGVVVLINPQYLEDLTDHHIQNLLEHELLHICFKHPLRGRDLDQKIYNAACDIAINELIDSVPEVALTYDKLFASMVVDRKREAEYYYKMIELVLKQQMVEDLDLETQDDHSLWHDDTGGVDTYLQEQADLSGEGSGRDSESEQEGIFGTEQEQIIDRIFKDSYEASSGELPGNVEGRALLELYKDNDYYFKKSWQQIFQHAINRNLYRSSLKNLDVKPSRKRPHKKLGYPFPSLKVHPRPGARVLVVLDSSGSVTENPIIHGMTAEDSSHRSMVDSFLHEVHCLCNREVDVDLMFADCTVFNPDFESLAGKRKEIDQYIDGARDLMDSLHFRHGVVHDYTPRKQDDLVEFMKVVLELNSRTDNTILSGISGGTSYVPAVKAAENLKPRPDLIVYFTDSYDDGTLKQGFIPCIFVLTEKREEFYPWATTVFIDDLA